MTNQNPKPETRILIIKLGALGDFLQALGPMAAIRRAHKDAKITLLTTRPFVQFAENCGLFDHIILDTRPKWFQFPAWLKLGALLNGKNFDRVYDLQNNDRTSFYFKLFKKPKPEWVGIAKGASHRNTSPDRSKGHAFDGHVQTLALAGITDVSIDKLEWMEADISTLGLHPPYVLLVPGAAPGHPYKRWSAQNYAETAIELAKIGYQPVIIGSHIESAIAKLIHTACPDSLDLTGKTTLPHIAVIARAAAAALGNDTGPMHLIAPTGCPSLVLFSKHSNPKRHYPLGERVHTLQEPALKDLAADKVFKTLKTLLNSKS